MDASRLSAAGGALALHGLVIAGVLALAVAPPAPRPLEPVQVVLLEPPEPLPVARQPAPPAREPDAAQPAAEPRRSPPTEVKPPPKTARARPRPAPPPEAAPTPTPAPAPTATHRTVGERFGLLHRCFRQGLGILRLQRRRTDPSSATPTPNPTPAATTAAAHRTASGYLTH